MGSVKCMRCGKQCDHDCFLPGHVVVIRQIVDGQGYAGLPPNVGLLQAACEGTGEGGRGCEWTAAHTDRDKLDASIRAHLENGK